MTAFRDNFEDDLYLDYLQQLERYPQRIFVDKGDPFNTLHEIQFHARFWLRRVHGDRVIGTFSSGAQKMLTDSQSVKGGRPRLKRF